MVNCLQVNIDGQPNFKVNKLYIESVIETFPIGKQSLEVGSPAENIAVEIYR
jgi:hypothetical protein